MAGVETSGKYGSECEKLALKCVIGVKGDFSLCLNLTECALTV